MSKSVRYRAPTDDAMVVEALKERRASDIALLECPRCGNLSYYNEGSHFSCSVEGCGWSCSGRSLDKLLADMPPITLQDWCENQTESPGP
jgi:hypothetical protein